MDKNQIGSFMVKQIGDEAARILEFVGTDESPDRMGDIIKADGWKFEDYQKNPVFIWAHDYYSIPLGKCLEITRATGSTGTKFKIKFASIEELCSNPDIPSEEAQFADTVYMAYKNGYLSGVSVGFQGLTSEERDDQKDLPSWQRGRVFTSQNLLELSAVVVPANQNALIQAQKSMAPDQFKQLESLLKAVTEKGAIPFKKFPLAEEGTSWDAGAVVKEADIDDLKVICAWYDSENADVKGSYKLPHHEGSAGGHRTVWKGVSAAMAALLGARGGVDIPEADRKAVYNHLKKHYAEFKKDVPEFKAYSPSELKSMFREDSDMDMKTVQKMIEEATAPLLAEVAALKAMGSVSTVTRSGAKFSADTKAKMTKAMDDMQMALDGYETHSKALKGVMTAIKGLMDGDGSQPDGQSSSEDKPQPGENGDVPAPVKALGDFIDLDTFVLK